MQAENDLVFCFVLNLSLFSCAVKNDVFLVWGSTDLALLWVVEIDLVLVYGPEIT